MQPTQAPNETRLPRAVVRRSAAIAARYAAPEANPNPEADPAAPAIEPAAAPATPDAPQAQAPVEPTDPRVNDPAYWRQRFNSTAGVLAKERTDRVSAEARLKQQVAELQDANRVLEASKPVPEAVIDLSEFFSPAEIEQYGEEQCKVMVRASMRAAAKTAKPAEVRPAPAAEPPPAQTHQTNPAVATFVQQLTELVPEYREWDVDPRWLAWLAEDTNGVQRQALLNVHIGNRDAKKVAKMFNDWDRSVAVPAPPISPGGTGAAPSGEAVRENHAEGLTYPTQAETRDFYKRAAVVRKGQPGYVTDEDRVKFEARLALRNAR